MRKVILLGMAAMTVFALNARQLTPRQALERALGNVPMSVDLSQDAQPVLTVAADNGIGDVYVFNAQRGYVVVAASDLVAPLLGYSDDGQPLDTGDMAPGLRYWLDEYARQIRYAENNGYSYEAKAAPQRDPIGPLVQTLWNQDAPYNDKTPAFSGSHAVTGCVATALAQVMKYYNYPPKGTSTHSYTSNGQTVSFDFGATTFDWPNMLDTYTASSTVAERDAVATLMLACGVSVDMEYTTSESGAASANVPAAMINYFGYDRGVRYVPRDYYGLDEWNDLVYNNLKEYGPMQYSGQSNEGGHSFVCDGYSEDNYFHINWGWGGMSDGYFLLTALTPQSQGIGGSASGYNYNQDIIAGVKVGDNGTPTGETYEQIYAQSSFAVSAESVALGNSVSFGTGFFNLSPAPINGTIGIKLVAADGTVSYIEGPGFTNMPSMAGYNTFAVKLPADLAADKYTVTPAFRTSTGEWRDIPVKLSGIQSLTMTVADNTATFGAGKVSAIAVTEYEAQSPFYIGSVFKVNARISNTSDGEYYGAVVLGLVSQQGSLIGQGVSYPVDIQAGESTDIQYISSFAAETGSTLSAGTYYIVFLDASTGRQLSDMKQITLNAATTPTLKVSAPTITDAESVDASNLTVSTTVECTQGYFGGTLTLVIFPYSSTGGSVSSVAIFSTDALFIDAGESRNVSITKTFDNAEVGKRYFCGFYSGRNPVSDGYGYFTVGKTSGVEDISVEADTAAPVYYNLQGVRVDNPAPGMYIVVKGDKVTRQLIR